MKTLEQAWNLIEILNDDAHDESWHRWIEADELADSDDEEDQERAEDVREQASAEQAEYFRDFWYELEQEDQLSIEHWLDQDQDFREQFASWFGELEFVDEFPRFGPEESDN